MAAATESEILDEIGEDFLCCSICMEQFKDPKILPCLHTFCQQCLVTLLKTKGSLQCPSCSTPCPIPTGGVSKLMTNFFMNNCIEIYHRLKECSKVGPIQCEGCQENTATHRCVECKCCLCNTCVKAHRNLPSTKTHQLLTIEEYKTRESTRPTVVQTVGCCSIHPKNEIEFYCDTCQVSVCTACTIVNHRIPQHVHRDLKDVADEYQIQLKDMVDKLKVKEQEADKNKTLAKQSHSQMNDKWKEEERKVRMKVEEVSNKIKKEEKRLIDELNREYGMKMKSAAVDIDELELKHGNIKSTCSYIETLLHHGNVVHLLSTKKAATDHIQQLITMETTPEPLQMVQFQPSKAFAEHGILGDIVKPLDVCISKCTVENIPKQLWKGDSANLLITTRDSKGKQVIPGQEVKAKVKKPDGSWEDIEVTDIRDGTHRVTVNGEMDGTYQVTMTIGDQPIPGSPVIIPIIQELVKTIGSRGSGEGQYNDPWSVAINRDRDIVTADRQNNRLQVTTRDGRFKKNLTFTLKQDYSPCNIAISSDNTYYSLDNRNNRVVVSTEDGHIIRCFGENELNDPCGLAISPVDGKVYVTDRDGHCVRIYTQDGKYIKSFGSRGKGQAEFNFPYFLAVDSTGRVFVADNGNNCIQVFTDSGEFRYAFGCYGDKDSQLDHPRGVAIENDRYVYVSDKRHVQKFDITGQFVCRIDSEKDGLNDPYGIALTDDVPCRVVVVDKGSKCLRVLYSNNKGV
ncbi:tripartite motif-containing protein 2-like [Glandiceps talaboti]